MDAGDPGGLCPRCLILGAFQSSMGGGEPATATISPAGAAAEDDFGRYRILQALGEGGMGTVYLAEQLAPIRRRVALKVVKLGMDSVQVLARLPGELWPRFLFQDFREPVHMPQRRAKIV